jgi:hypothetical protein
MSEIKTGLAKYEVGQPFNPFAIFTGIFIPEAIVNTKNSGIPLAAKIGVHLTTMVVVLRY